MRDFDTTHIILLAVTVAFAILSCCAVSRMSRRWQNVTFVFGAFMVVAGIFFRYGWGLTFGGEITWQTLGLQMLQVCNFNMILVLLMLVPKFELARQYSVFFSMFAAFTTLVSIPNVWQNYPWHSPEILNSWLNHVFAICLPLWMVAARRLKPRPEYVLPVTGCVVGYFSVVAALSALLIKSGIITAQTSYSFVYNTEGIGVFEILRRLIPLPYFYLWPLVPFMMAFFWLLARVFKGYKVGKF